MQAYIIVNNNNKYYKIININVLYQVEPYYCNHHHLFPVSSLFCFLHNLCLNCHSICCSVLESFVVKNKNCIWMYGFEIKTNKQTNIIVIIINDDDDDNNNNTGLPPYFKDHFWEQGFHCI